MAEIRINATGGVKLYDADDSHYAQIVAGTITSNVDAITLAHDSVTLNDNLVLGSDSAVIKFGADSEITLTHSADTGLNLKHTATADDKPIVLTLQTGETDMAANDVIGTINFQAPDEGTGTDAILVAAGISAISEGNFSSSANATKLSFKTAASEAAAEKMSLSSAGLLTVADDIVFKDGGTIGVSSATDAMTVSSGGIVTFKDDILIKDGGTIGAASDADSIAIASDGVVTFTQAPVFPNGSIDLLDLDIDGGTEIGAAIVDADLFIVDDGAGGTNRKVLASRIKTYAGSSFDIGTFTRDISTADGTQAVTGVGFQPTHIIFHANINNVAGGFSVGFDDGTTRRGSGIDGDTANTFSDGSSTTDISILCRDVAGTSGASYEGSVTTLGADGFTITWNKIGSPTGSLVIYYMAFA